MSLALWEFFWEWGGTPAPTPSPSPTPAPGPPASPLPAPPDSSGGGGGKGWGKGGKKQREYVPNPVDLWEVRERYLRTLNPPPITPAPRPVEEYEAEANQAEAERQQQIAQLNADRQTALLAMQAATDFKTLKSNGAKVKELTAKIAQLTNKQAFSRFMRK